LWLTRPPGWEDELAAIDAERLTQVAEDREARDERSAVRRLAVAQAVAAQATAEAEERSRALDALQRELDRERALREETAHRLGEAESEVARLTAARAEVVRKLKDVEARLVERSTELNTLKARARQLEAADPTPATVPPAQPVEAPVPGPPAAPVVVPQIAAAPEPAVTGDHDGLGALPGDLVGHVERAAGGAADLARALAAIVDLLGPRSGDGRRDGLGHDGKVRDGHRGDGYDGPLPAAPDRDPGAGAGRHRSGRRHGGLDGRRRAALGGTGRVPVRLPGGLFDDSIEAADYLLHLPGALLVVDGYNVSMTAWPEVSVADQRRRLVAALGDLAARTSMPVEVVFDGADVGPAVVPGTARALVRTRFSPPGVEADDVVLDLVAQLPPARPVVVVSSDNRVREGARRLGANTLQSAQLVAVLARR
jgi:predicted RNA-binding protein with PIN domain